MSPPRRPEHVNSVTESEPVTVRSADRRAERWEQEQNVDPAGNRQEENNPAEGFLWSVGGFSPQDQDVQKHLENPTNVEMNQQVVIDQQLRVMFVHKLQIQHYFAFQSKKCNILIQVQSDRKVSIVLFILFLT